VLTEPPVQWVTWGRAAGA